MDYVHIEQNLFRGLFFLWGVLMWVHVSVLEISSWGLYLHWDISLLRCSYIRNVSLLGCTFMKSISIHGIYLCWVKSVAN